MKAALLTIAALMAAYVIFIQQPDAARKEYEQREAARLEAEELQRNNDRDIANLEAQDRRNEKFAKEAAFRAEIEKIKEKATKTAVANTATETETPAPVETPPDHGAFAQYADRVFIVKGDAGSGSGFICKINGNAVAITNIHVLSGNKTLVFERPDGKAISVLADQLTVAMDRDLAFFPLKDKQPVVELGDPTQVKIGDEIACFGNSEGQSVITDIKGTVLGLGPREIEVDAEVVKGNSGCPVIHIPTGKVIGVVTRAAKGDLSLGKKGTRFEEVRKFCLKVDGAQWQNVGWLEFAAQANLISSYRKNRENLEALFSDLSAGRLNPPGYDMSSDHLRGAVKSFITASTSPNMSDVDKRKAQTNFLAEFAREVRKGTFADVDQMEIRASSLCEFHRSQLMEEIRSRKEIATQVSQLGAVAIAIAGASRAPVVPARPKRQLNP